MGWSSNQAIPRPVPTRPFHDPYQPGHSTTRTNQAIRPVPTVKGRQEWKQMAESVGECLEEDGVSQELELLKNVYLEDLQVLSQDR